MNQNNISLEKVINGLECCEHLSGEYCRLCPYREDITADTPPCCTGALAHDALALLKAQEPVKPKIVDTSNSKLYHNDMFKNHYCGNCGEFLHVMNRKDMFCSQCGRAVKWE